MAEEFRGLNGLSKTIQNLADLMRSKTVAARFDLCLNLVLR